LLTLFPNPIQTRKALAIYVGGVENNSTKLELYDITGKTLLSRTIPTRTK